MSSENFLMPSESFVVAIDQGANCLLLSTRHR